MDHTVELVLTSTRDAVHKREPIKLPRYQVRLDGETIGTVERALLTRERRTPGRRYVNSRWESPGWRYARTGSRSLECTSRRSGVVEVLHDFGRGLPLTESEELAKAAKVVES
ncbi:hypothetical protein [Longimicrobium sp.]|jgi:hypothetical protein|uniref:hypothetical protein n=1 Tax=Longimicrobium sp. TaxID=2029185 RepID=UPI002ED7A8C3